uniref:NADH-ubiquinone oxidoreductase chain 4 n=1 Tax=Eiconaxius sp. 1 QK-2020 TaxID=2699496 RepID=A0A6M5U7U8_9EUCA|nr:NADH dehydrogenase subunit 4 [Eiconaxius sp. 1 QK-2020]
MLKLIFMLIMLIPLMNWSLIQNFLLFVCFLVGFYFFHDFYMFNVGMSMGTDFISYTMVFLSIWIIMLVVYSSQKINKMNKFPISFLSTSIILCLALVFTFSSMDYFLFYMSFESSLIPTLILILGWGYQPERIQAGTYMLFYTLFASLPLLVSLLSFYKLGGTLTIGMTSKIMLTNFTSMMWYFSTIFAFLVKLPMYLFHLWLPKAHVEAPVAGSMILAGVLLKLGGYGLIRVMPLFLKLNKMFSWIWVSVGVTGGIVVSFICLRQIDMKSLIAYSSVAHMGLVLCGFMVLNSWGMNGGMIVMIGHGLCSSGLFCLANMVYERTSSRSLLISKGLLNFMPSLGLWWFLLSISNMAAPPSLNLLGEISLILSVMSWSKLSMIGVALLSFFSATYTLYLYSTSQHGIYFSSLFSCCSGNIQEYMVLMLHWVPLNILIFKGTTMIFI